jgi:hypothetical protein
MFVIPGSASQFAASAATSVVGPNGTTSGLFNDPDTAPVLSITLPSHFTAVNPAGDPLGHFAG